MHAAVVVEVQVETVSSAATEDEMEMRSDVSIFLRGGPKSRGEPPPVAYDHRRNADSSDDWYARASANSLVHAVVETRMSMSMSSSPRRICCRGVGAASSSSILRCVTTCFADARLRAYSVANDSASNLKREIVDRGPVLFALPVADGGVHVPACLLGWRDDGWIVGVPAPATTHAADAWGRNGCVLLPLGRLDVAATEFIGCVRAPLLHVANSEDAGATRVQLFEPPPERRQRQRHNDGGGGGGGGDDPWWWWSYTDAAALVTAALLATGLLILTLLELIVRPKAAASSSSLF